MTTSTPPDAPQSPQPPDDDQPLTPAAEREQARQQVAREALAAIKAQLREIDPRAGER